MSLKLLFLSASEYVGIELRKTFPSDEMSDILDLLISAAALELLVGGIFFVDVNRGIVRFSTCPVGTVI